VVEERLDILTEGDLEGDWTTEGELREYRFVIFDKGGNGLCCNYGSGHYEIYSKNSKLILTGNVFGPSSEHFFSVDPADFLSDDSDSTVSNINGKGDDGNGNANANEGVGNTSNANNTNNSNVANEGTGNDDSSSTTENNDIQSTNSTTEGPTPDASSPTPKPTPSTAQIALDSDAWFCGVSWDWVINNCGLATPCPNGDKSVCPEDQACFASTPCTLSPTSAPSDMPSAMPSKMPTMSPTRAPWSEKAFLDFLYGENTAENDVDGSQGGNGGEKEQDDILASELDNALENYNELQYHFFCGFSWYHADATCSMFCPLGDKSDCPEGMECYANTRCDGRDTPPPTISPAPSMQRLEEAMPSPPSSSSSSSSSSSIVTDEFSDAQVCSVCYGSAMDEGQTVQFNATETTCGKVDWALSMQRVKLDSDLCSTFQSTYRSQCCYDQCQLCLSTDANILDLRPDYLLEQGGYSATCGEVNAILSVNSKTDKLCVDAQAQLTDDCCYKQCKICGNNGDISNDWYATVKYEGATTSCLGLDYMLRIRQVGQSTDDCKSIQATYENQCCYVTPDDQCQICEADGVLYDVIGTKTVTYERSSMTATCAVISDFFAKMESTDQECIAGKQTLFGQCCDLSSVVVLNDASTDASNPNSNTPGGSSSSGNNPNTNSPNGGNNLGGIDAGSDNDPNDIEPSGGNIPSGGNPSSGQDGNDINPDGASGGNNSPSEPSGTNSGTSAVAEGGEGWWKATPSPTPSTFNFVWDPPNSAMISTPTRIFFIVGMVSSYLSLF